jgi:protein-L-isoaspartate(D-aspartate) O-methyltransferase
MTEALALEGTERILEIGTGSGYQAAILSRLAARVFSIERIALLAERARRTLAALGCAVDVRVGDGYAGWPEAAPFDRILLTAAPEGVPRALLDQLVEGGSLVATIGRGAWSQELVRVRKIGNAIEMEPLCGVRFVPMIEGVASP